MLKIFYEDQRGPRGEFGFHRFICQLVMDRTNLPGTVYEVERKLIEGIPLKGAGNVLKKCRKDLPRLANRVKKVIAVFDQDRLPELLRLSGIPCRPVLRDALLESCNPRGAIEIVLIKQNIESVIKAIRNSGLASFIDEKVFDGALSKNHPTRDSVFIQCATKTTLELRSQLLDQHGDVKRLVTKIVESIQPANP